MLFKNSLPTRLRRAAPPVALALALITFVGCGGNETPTYPAGGQVRFPDGAPLDEGWVEFESLDGDNSMSARGQIQPDGTFQLGTFEPGDGAVAGEHRVVVVVPVSEAAALNPAAYPRRIAPRFSDFEQSGLRFTVQADGQNQFEIEVEAP